MKQKLIDLIFLIRPSPDKSVVPRLTCELVATMLLIMQQPTPAYMCLNLNKKLNMYRHRNRVNSIMFLIGI